MPAGYAVAERKAACQDAAGLDAAGLLQRVDVWLDARLHEPIHVLDICAAFAVSPRTLQRAFHRQVGIGPAHYLARKRLAMARESLLNADPNATSVTQIALSLGFLELGRFAGTYARAFGEWPSQTLRTRRSHSVRSHEPDGRQNAPSGIFK